MKLVGMGSSAEFLLASFATELAGLGVDVPTAQYVGAGEIPWDGESLTIYLSSVAQGFPGAPIGRSLLSTSEIVTTATLQVQLLRIVSVIGDVGGRLELPDEKALNTDGLTAMDDAGALYQAALNIKNKGKMVPLGVDFAILTALPLGPLGGMAGVRLGLDISVDGQ
jgi:hypothetical protein